MSEGLDLGTVAGELELTDNFTKRLFAAGKALNEIEAQAGSAGKTGTKVFEVMSGAVQNLTGALGIGFGLGALISYGKGVLDAGDQIQRFADRTGLSVEEVQKLAYAASQGGNEIEDLTTAVGMMQVRLNDVKAQAAIQGLGVDFEKLRAMKPYDQMIEIAEGISKIPDPAKQAEAAMAIFGRGGIAILPTLKAGMKELGEEAVTMGANTVAALDRMGDRLAKWSGQLKAVLGNAAGDIIQAGEGLAEGGWKAWFLSIDLFIKGGAPQAIGALKALKQAGDASAPNKDVYLSAKTATDLYNESLRALILEHRSLTPAQQKAVDMGKLLGQTNQEIATGLGVNIVRVNDYVVALEKQQAISKKVADEQHAVTDSLFGIDLTEKAGLYARALGDVSNWTKLTKDKQIELKQVMADAVQVYKDQGRETDALAVKYKALGDSIIPRETLHEWIVRRQAEIKAERDASDEADRSAKQAADDLRKMREQTDLARESADRLKASFSFTTEITALNAGGFLQGMGLGGYTNNGELSGNALDMARAGYSFAEIVNFLRTGRRAEKPIGPRLPGFESGVLNFEGGEAVVGEGGPEIVRLPRGADVLPNSEVGAGRTMIQHNTFHLHGATEELARKLEDIWTRKLWHGRQVPSIG